MARVPSADSPSSPSLSEAELQTLVHKLHDSGAADRLARWFVQLVEREIGFLGRGRIHAGEVADAVQEMVVTLFEALPRYDVNQSCQLRTFLVTILRRRFANYCRGERRRKRRERRSADATPSE